MSPHTGHGSPVRAWTCRPLRFSPLSVAAFWPTDRSTAAVSVAIVASYNVAISPSVSRAAILNGDRCAVCRISSE